jgi:hypothetical protein
MRTSLPVAATSPIGAVLMPVMVAKAIIIQPDTKQITKNRSRI